MSIPTLEANRRKSLRSLTSNKICRNTNHYKTHTALRNDVDMSIDVLILFTM